MGLNERMIWNELSDMMLLAVIVLLLPILLLIGGAFVGVSAMLVWDRVVAGWHSGYVPLALGCVVVAFALLAWGPRHQRPNTE